MQNFSFKTLSGGLIRVIIISLFATLACVGIIKAATTIGTNISTGGTITGSGTNNFYGATSIGGALTATSTLTVSGLTTLGNASTTVFSVSGNSYIATTTLSGNMDMGNKIIQNIGAAGTDFTATGGLTLANALTVSAGGMNIAGDTTTTIDSSVTNIETMNGSCAGWTPTTNWACVSGTLVKTAGGGGSATVNTGQNSGQLLRVTWNLSAVSGGVVLRGCGQSLSAVTTTGIKISYLKCSNASNITFLTSSDSDTATISSVVVDQITGANLTVSPGGVLTTPALLISGQHSQGDIDSMFKITDSNGAVISHYVYGDNASTRGWGLMPGVSGQTVPYFALQDASGTVNKKELRFSLSISGNYATIETLNTPDMLIKPTGQLWLWPVTTDKDVLFVDTDDTRAFLPYTTLYGDIGSASKRWDNLYIEDIYYEAITGAGATTCTTAGQAYYDADASRLCICNGTNYTPSNDYTDITTCDR